MTTDKFEVYSEENSNYADECARRKLGEFASFDEAREICKKIIDDFLSANYEQGISAEKLYQIYKMFGEDLFIVGDSADEKFSAWQYAEERCQKITQIGGF